jgi:hypothetical protein
MVTTFDSPGWILDVPAVRSTEYPGAPENEAPTKVTAALPELVSVKV